MTSADGPFVVWADYGCEGWKPESYPTLKEALEAPRFSSGRVVIMRPVRYDIVEKDEA